MNTTNLSKSDGYVLGVLVQLDKLGLIHQKFLLSIVASYRKKGYLSQQQISYARSILTEHYSEQISKLKNVPNLKAEKGNKNKPRLASSSGAKAIRLQFGRQSDVLSVVSGLSGARYRNRGPGDCFWVVKKSVAAYQLLSNLGFSFDEPLQDWYAEAKKIGEIKKIPGLKTELRAYQKHAVGFFDARKGRALLADDMGLGKEQPGYCKVLTPYGWKRMDSVYVGMPIFGMDGKVHRVNGVFPQGIKPSYKITFRDGTSTECGLDHLWFVQGQNAQTRGKGWTVLPLSKLLQYGITKKTGASKWFIPLTSPIQFKTAKLPIDPYVLGVLLGDGSLHGSSISITKGGRDRFVMDKVQKNMPRNIEMKCKNYQGNTWKCSFVLPMWKRGQPHVLLDAIRGLKLRVHGRDKFIPSMYKYASVPQRLELLRGLMDTDGSAKKNRITYHSTNKKLAYDVADIVRSLGGMAIIRFYPRSRKENKPDEYQVNVKMDRFCPFSLPRKAEQWWPAKPRRINKKYIQSVEYVRDVEQFCISVDSKEHLYITDDYTVTHNTVQVLAWLQKNKETAIPALVVCPNSVKINWARETVKHTRLLPLILDGRPKKNGLDFLRKELSEKHVIIVNYDVIANTKTKNGEISGWGSVLTKAGIKTVVADECQYLQNGKSKRTKSFRFIQRKAKHFLPLSGKPITNKPIEFWPVLNMLDRAVFHDWFWFVKRYCDGKKDHWNRWDVSGSSNTEELHELLNNTYMLRRTKAEVLTELPAKNRIALPMEISNRKEYEEALLNFQEWLVSQGKPPTQTAMTKIEMLKQIAVRGKIPQVSEWISEFLDGGEKLVVFCTHHFAIDELKNIFGKVAVKLDGRDNGNKRQAAIDSFVHDKKTRLFIGQLAAAGVGIDGLQRVCSTTCFVELGWTSAAHDQAEDRVHRFGQEAQTVSAYYPIAENTIEEDIIDAIDRKRILLDMIMDGEDTSDDSLLSELLAKIGG